MTPNSTGSSREKRSNGLVISRRAFLGVSAGLAAAIAAGYVIRRSEINFLLEPQESTEGVLTEKWVATSCLNCPARCAIKVRVVNGKAAKIAGNTKSTYSDGKICPRSHIGLQVLYDPDRVTSPLKRTNQQKGRGEDPRWEPIGWDEALSEIKEELERSASAPEKVLFIQGLNTNSDEDLIRRFAKAYGTVNLLAEDALETGADREGKQIADGRNNSGYELESTNYILAFSASIVESERPLARNLRMWGKIHRERPNRAKIVVIDPRYSLTAAKADEWIPINPGTEGALAMAMANVIVSEGLYDTDFVGDWTSGFNNYRNLVLSNDFSPESVAEITGISADTIRRLAREFAQSKPAIAWSGAGATSWPHGTYASHAIYCLNALVGSIDVPGGIVYQESPPYRDMPAITGNEPGISVHQAADLIWNNNVEMVMGFNSNLVMSVPDTSRWDEALANIPYYVHIAPSLTEMANYADIVLPACTYLEEWAYESSLPGSGFAEAKIKQPVVELQQDSRPTAQIIFTLASQLGGKVKNAFENIGDDPKGFVEYRTGAFVPWDTFEADGVWKGPDYQYRKYNQIFHTPSKKFEFHLVNLDKLLNVEFLGDNSEYPLKLITYHPVLDIMNGNQNYPWAQEIFLVMQGFGWANFVEINSDTAHKLGIKDGDTVWAESEFGQIKAKARVFEGVLPGVVAIASGQGHYSSGRWANGIGVNPNEIIGVDYDGESGQPSFFNTRIRVYKA